MKPFHYTYERQNGHLTEFPIFISGCHGTEISNLSSGLIFAGFDIVSTALTSVETCCSCFFAIFGHLICTKVLNIIKVQYTRLLKLVAMETGF